MKKKMIAVLEGTASGLITNFSTGLISSFNKKWSIKHKKKRLKGKLNLIHSVLDAAERRVIFNPSLRRWLSKLKKAAELGDCALKMVKRLLMEERKAKTGSSLFGPISSVAAFAKKILFSGGVVSKELDFALAKLESACRNLKIFLRLIELEAFSSKKDGFPVRHLRVKAIYQRTNRPAIPPRNSV